MASKGSVTSWIDAVKLGDDSAAQRLWERYFDQLVRYARNKLGNTPRRVADEEDVVLAAFDAFYRAAKRGTFPQLRDRDDLWQILLVITARKKAASQIRHLYRQKRGGGRVLGESVLEGGQPIVGSPAMERVVGDAPTPEFAVLAAEEFDRLFGLLNDATLRQVVLWKMQGYLNHEIADQLDCSLRTVERKLQVIRVKWSQEVEA